MANTYNQIYIHLVFAVKYRDAVIDKSWRQELYQFAWQEGFGAFSYGKSQVDHVVKYIQNQEVHHAKRSFKDEYISFLKLFGIEYDEKYVFREME